MKKVLIITFTALSAILILDSMQAGQALVDFFVAGIIPGTNKSLSASMALQIFALLGGFTFARLTKSRVENLLQKFLPENAA